MNDTPKQSWWQRLSGGLKRTSASIGSAISDLVSKRKLDAATIEELEELLIRADLGVDVAARIAAAIGEGRYDKQVSDAEVKAILAGEVEKVLAPVAKPLAIDAAAKPFVILVVGVNGSGKTTTIGKLAARFRAEGRKVMLAAGDTFRAAAIEQLKIWGERTGATVIAREQGSDAASLAFEALTAAQSARRRRADRRHRRPPAEPDRADGRAGKDRARDAEGRAERAACRAAGARRHRRAERAVAGCRDSPASRASPAW